MADRLAEIAGNAAASFGGRATRRNTIHLTLAFLGEVPESRLPELCVVADGIKAPSFSMVLDRLGYWHHNRLLWAGSQGPVTTLGELVRQLRNALANSGFLVDAEKKGFVPHVTLVRKIPASTEPRENQPFPSFESLTWRADRFVLVRSRLSSSGSEYLILREFSLS
ncbi:MAG: 2,5 ligase [Proteobacteria bacterium]|nr:2,5 ligase [Pseudomonadota bacterium]